MFYAQDFNSVSVCSASEKLGCSATQTLTVLIKASPSPRIVMSSEPESASSAVKLITWSSHLFVWLLVLFCILFTHPGFLTAHSWAGDSASALWRRGTFSCRGFNTSCMNLNFVCTGSKQRSHTLVSSLYFTSGSRSSLLTAPRRPLLQVRCTRAFPFPNYEQLKLTADQKQPV